MLDSPDFKDRPDRPSREKRACPACPENRDATDYPVCPVPRAKSVSRVFPVCVDPLELLLHPANQVMLVSPEAEASPASPAATDPLADPVSTDCPAYLESRAKLDLRVRPDPSASAVNAVSTVFPVCPDSPD